MKLPLISSLIALTVLANSAFAGDRRFTYTYETTTLPKGAAEFETWVTWKAYRSDGPDRDKFEFRHEFEIGITDKLQLGLYLPNWSVDKVEGMESKSKFDSVGAELIYNLSNPTTDWLGSAIYGEVRGGEDLCVLEGKILLQKNIGSWIFAWNGIVEAEWEGKGLEEEIGVLEQTLGVSYQFTPKFSLGVEAKHEIEFEEWSEAGDHVVYAGPNMSFRYKDMFVALTGMVQVTDVEGKADAQTRLIVGFHF